MTRRLFHRRHMHLRCDTAHFPVETKRCPEKIVAFDFLAHKGGTSTLQTLPVTMGQEVAVLARATEIVRSVVSPYRAKTT